MILDMIRKYDSKRDKFDYNGTIIRSEGDRTVVFTTYEDHSFIFALHVKGECMIELSNDCIELWDIWHPGGLRYLYDNKDIMEGNVIIRDIK